MFVEFSVGNFRSFRDHYTLSLAATSLKSAPADEDLDQGNVFEAPFSGSEAPLRLLTGAAIYGANASGKSNVAAALDFMREFVLNSSKESQAHEQIEVEPFRLSTATEAAPSFLKSSFCSAANGSATVSRCRRGGSCASGFSASKNRK